MTTWGVTSFLDIAADLGDMNSILMISQLKINSDDGFPYLVKAAKRGNPTCMAKLGAHLFDKKNLEEAEIWLSKAAEKGDIQAARFLGMVLADQDSPEGAELAEFWLRKIVENGDMRDAHVLGCVLHKQNKLDEAEVWLRKAANSNNQIALHNLASLLHDKKKLDEAEIWYRKAIKMGDKEAMHNFAVLLYNKKILKKAERWFHKAALKGIVPSMVQLGRFYLDREELANATFWFEKAAALGNQEAQNLLEASRKRVQPLASNNDGTSEAPVTMNLIEDVNDNIDSELDEIFEKIENPELQTISNIQMSEQNVPLPETPESDTTSFSSEDELEEDPMPAPQVTVAPDISPKVKPQVINNPKSRREKARLLGQELRKITEEAQKPDRQLTESTQKIANDILSNDTDHIGQADLETLFKDPYFAGQVIVDTTKSGFTVLSHHREKKRHLNAGAHRKHGQEKYTGRIHPNTLRRIKGILNLFDVEKK